MIACILCSAAATSRVLGGGEKKLCHAASRPSGIYTTYLVGWYSYSTARAICQANSEIFSCLLFGGLAAEREKAPPCEKDRRAGACIFAQCIKKVRRDGRLCPPAENPVFTETFGEFATSLGRTGSSAPTNIPEATQNRDGSGSSACSRSVSMSISPKTSMPFFLKSAAVTPSPGVSLPEKVPS